MDIETKLREALDGVTPGPWGWVIHDHSMASLGVLPDPGLGDPLVMCVSPCGSCQERANPKEWEWGRCHTPSETDAAYIALCSPDNIGTLLDTIASLRSKLEEAEGALEKCQRVLAMMTDGKMSKPSVVSAFAQCVEAEIAARRTLASLREADHA